MTTRVNSILPPLPIRAGRPRRPGWRRLPDANTFAERRPLNLFYALGATATHAAPAAADVSGAQLMNKMVATIEADTVLFPQGTARPITTATMTRYRVTVGQIAEATIAGMLHR